MSGVCYVKSGGVWLDMNFTSGHSIHVKDGGVWEELTQISATRKMYVKKSGTWEQVYPSLTETWTTSKLGTVGEQGSYSASDYAFNGSYPYTNVTSAATAVKWTGTISTSTSKDGRELKTSDFDWSPSTTAGFENGAISRIEVTTVDTKIDPSVYPNTTMSVNPTNATPQTLEIISSNRSLTFDYTVAEWGLDPDEAGWLHTTPIAGKITLYPVTEAYGAGGTGNFTVEDVQCRIQYKHN